MANKKKLATKAVAVATAAALLLGGTFAWQSISQTALNEASAVINPGGRLHDDFNGTNKDVYVENFANEDIFARVRVEEYFEIVMNKGLTDANGEFLETVDYVAGAKDEYGNIVRWETHDFGGENLTKDYWDWQVGGKTVFMPTFNKNKDSIVADINGTYAGPDGDASNEEDMYKDYYAYQDGEEVEALAIYDADSNDYDEYADETGTSGVNYIEVTETHIAKETLETLGVISMQEWIDDGSPVGAYWVYDTDGWVYWAAPIPAGEATGLLLDGISLNRVMDDSWYYAINVIGQFITADDLGQTDNTGFYQDPTSVPTAEALALLQTIGVTVDGEAGGGDNGGDSGSDNGGDQLANTMVFTGVQPNEANFLAKGDTVITIYDENGVAYDLSEESTYGLAASMDGENWYAMKSKWADGTFNTANMLGKTSSAVEFRLGVADFTDVVMSGTGIDVVTSDAIVWQSEDLYYMYHSDIHEYIQTYEYENVMYVVMRDLVKGDNTLCVIDPSTHVVDGEPAHGVINYATEVTSVDDIDWANLSNYNKCDSEL